MPVKDIFRDIGDDEMFVEPIDAFIVRLQEIRAAIPEKRRADAFVSFSCRGDHAHTYATVIY